MSKTTEPAAPADPTAALYAALARAQGAMGTMEKSARNQFAKYDYVPGDVIIGAAGPVLQEHGLALIPVGSRTDRDVGEPPKGDSMGQIRAVRHGSWLLTHAGGGSVLIERSLPIPLEKKPLDKQSFAADTAMLSYLLRDLLMIQRGEGPDIDARDDGETGGEQLPAPPPRQPRSRNPQPPRGRPGAKAGGPVDKGPLVGESPEEQDRIKAVRGALVAMQGEGWQPEAIAAAMKSCGIAKGKVPTPMQVQALLDYWDEGKSGAA